MVSSPSDLPKRNRLLSEAVRLIRRARRLRAREVAQAMGVAQRSYEHFEGGEGRPNLERIEAFAAATDSDPHAILAALMIASPKFALRTADNKLMTAFLIGLREFDEDLGDQIAELETSTIVAAFSQAFATLAADARTRTAWRQAWLGRMRRDPEAPPEPDPDPDADGDP
jgi:transcriptional regulator with XRE-family HTH domain